MEKPGVCGVAARLPKNPGTQKLTPPSSARAMPGASASAQNRATPFAAFRTPDIERPRSKPPRLRSIDAAQPSQNKLHQRTTWLNRKFNSCVIAGICTAKLPGIAVFHSRF
jgi:hypothetical protein